MVEQELGISCCYWELGARKAIEATVKFDSRSAGTIFMRTNGRLRMVASLFNAIWALCGAKTASVARKTLSKRVSAGS